MMTPAGCALAARLAARRLFAGFGDATECEVFGKLAAEIVGALGSDGGFADGFRDAGVTWTDPRNALRIALP